MLIIVFIQLLEPSAGSDAMDIFFKDTGSGIGCRNAQSGKGLTGTGGGFQEALPRLFEQRTDGFFFKDSFVQDLFDKRESFAAVLIQA